jgi:hypothetical protein
VKKCIKEGRMIYEKSIDLLGCKVKDKISGRSGIVTSICFDLYGCIQAVFDTGKVGTDGKQITVGWIDVNRLEIKSQKRIMKLPDFETIYNTFEDVHGPADKPII